MQKTRSAILLLCILNTIAGILFAVFAQMPDSNQVTLLGMGASLSLSVVLWTTAALTVVRKHVTWNRFISTSIKVCCFYLMAVFLAAAILEQPTLHLAGWGEQLMASVFARLIGILIAMIGIAIVTRIADAIRLHRFRKKYHVTD